MARYIDAEKLLSEYLDLSESEFPTASGSLDEFLNNDIPNLIRNFNTEEVQPIIHAKWIDRKDWHSCSNCGAVLEEDYKWHYHAYCYHCGAIMNAK